MECDSIWGPMALSYELVATSYGRVFRLEKATVVAGRWMIGLGLAISLGFGLSALAQALGYLADQQDLLIGMGFGAAFALIGVWAHFYGKNQRVEVSDDRLVIYDSFNRREFDVAWSDISSFERTHVRSWIIRLPRPRWRVSSGKKAVWVPYPEEYVDFQRLLLRRIPRTAIPSKYFDHHPKADVLLDTPIKQFSLTLDNEGLSVHSAVAKASIRWDEVEYVEEIDYNVASDDDDPRVPRVYVLSATDEFELTRAWDKYDEIRDLIFAKAPNAALVVR